MRGWRSLFVLAVIGAVALFQAPAFAMMNQTGLQGQYGSMVADAGGGSNGGYTPPSAESCPDYIAENDAQQIRVMAMLKAGTDPAVVALALANEAPTPPQSRRCFLENVAVASMSHIAGFVISPEMLLADGGGGCCSGGGGSYSGPEGYANGNGGNYDFGSNFCCMGAATLAQANQIASEYGMAVGGLVGAFGVVTNQAGFIALGAVITGLNAASFIINGAVGALENAANGGGFNNNDTGNSK